MRDLFHVLILIFYIKKTFRTLQLFSLFFFMKLKVKIDWHSRNSSRFKEEKMNIEMMMIKKKRKILGLSRCEFFTPQLWGGKSNFLLYRSWRKTFSKSCKVTLFYYLLSFSSCFLRIFALYFFFLLFHGYSSSLCWDLNWNFLEELSSNIYISLLIISGFSTVLIRSGDRENAGSIDLTEGSATAFIYLLNVSGNNL